jgi:predicted TIM-barrel fold metal-dependent hydrolase
MCWQMPQDKLMKIDAHHHLWDLSAVTYPWLMERGVSRFFGDPKSIQRNYLIDEFRASADAQGIGASVHIQVGAADPWKEAFWVQSIADSNPDWPLVQVVYCDLTDPKREQNLDRYTNLASVVGVRQIIGRAAKEDAATGTNALLDDPRFIDGLHSLARRGLSFDLQLTPDLMLQAAQVFTQTPYTKIALCHAGSPQDRSKAGLSNWANNLKHLARLPNVFCKLSGLGMFEHNWTTQSFKPIVDACLAEFGADRLMFGSNFPVDSLSSSFQELYEAYVTLVPETDHECIFGKTAYNFYFSELGTN